MKRTEAKMERAGRGVKFVGNGMLIARAPRQCVHEKLEH